jgi:spore germination protein GerM
VAQNVVPHAPGTLFVYRVALSDSDKRQSDENDLVPVVAPVAVDSRTPMRDALLAQIEIPGSPIPKGSKIRSIRFNQASGLVTVDFSDSFVSKFSGGDTAEAQVVNSVVKTLSQFPGVQSVQFLVHGQKVASLGGTFDLSEPVPTGAAKPASSG